MKNYSSVLCMRYRYCLRRYEPNTQANTRMGSHALLCFALIRCLSRLPAVISILNFRCDLVERAPQLLALIASVERSTNADSSHHQLIESLFQVNTLEIIAPARGLLSPHIIVLVQLNA